jgi:hypothetical protein
MAEIRNQILGKVSGKLGDIVFRKMNGKTVVSIRPRNYKPTKSEKARKTRSKFGLIVSFAKYINSIPYLKEVWLRANIPGSNSYQKIIKHNSKVGQESTLTIKNIITPKGFPITVEGLSVKNNKISLTLNFHNIEVAPYEVHLIIYFYEPVNENEKQNIFDSMIMNIPSNSEKNLYHLEMELDNKQISLFEKYSKQILYIAVVTNAPDKNTVFWSSTFAASLNAD